METFRKLSGQRRGQVEIAEVKQDGRMWLLQRAVLPHGLS